MPRSALIPLLFLLGCGPAQPVNGIDVKAAPAAGAGTSADSTGDLGPRGMDTAAWERFLSAHVDGQGLVDYRAAAVSSDLRVFVAQLSAVRPADLPSSDARKAFWINAYNALAILAVTETIPDEPAARAAYSVIRQPREGLPASKGFFQGIAFDVGGRRWTLDEIEKQALLRRWADKPASERAIYRTWAPDRGDPRLHFALVCCARGCPKLQRIAYDGQTIDAQLDQATRAFFHDAEKSRFDVERRSWQVSELLNWYGGDFTEPGFVPRADTLASFASRYVDDARLKAALTNGRLKVSYLPYDWTLNAQD